MAMIIHYLNDAWDLLRQGFGQINAILGLLIALYFVYRMNDWRELWRVALGATVIYVIARVLVPMIDHNAPFQLPPMVESRFFWNLVSLFLGYMLVLAVFYFVKTNVFKKAGGHSH